MKITKPGIYYDLAAADYFADPCPEPSLTQSIAKVLLARSPAHARLAHPRLSSPHGGEPESYSAARAIGEAAHLAMIGRGKRLAVCNADSWRAKDAAKFRTDALAAGLTPILRKHEDRARAIIETASYQLHAAGHREAFRVGHGEVVLAWQEDGIWLRTMIDWLIDTTAVYDLKTTGLSCAPHEVAERPSQLGWDIQAAMHERGLNVLDPDGAGKREHYYVAQENEPPYALTIVQISEHDLHMGRRKLEAAVAKWRECITSGEWPLYEPANVVSTPRSWTETRWLEREILEENARLDELARRKDEGEPLTGHDRAAFNILGAG